MAMGIILFIPIIILWIGNLSILWTLENKNKILLNNFLILVSVFAIIFILSNIGARLPLVTAGVLFVLLHPVILFIYLIAERKKIQKPPAKDDILDDF